MIFPILHLTHFTERAASDNLEANELIGAKRTAFKTPPTRFRTSKFGLQCFLLFLRHILFLEMGTKLAMPLLAFITVSKNSLKMLEKMQFRYFSPDLDRTITRLTGQRGGRRDSAWLRKGIVVVIALTDTAESH
jgi:hypothetical protein